MLIIHLSTIIVVAEVPSIEMDTMRLRSSRGTSSSSNNSVSFHERTQSYDSPLFLDKRNRNLSQYALAVPLIASNNTITNCIHLVTSMALAAHHKKKWHLQHTRYMLWDFNCCVKQLRTPTTLISPKSI